MARYNEIARSLGRKGEYQPILELDTDETSLWEIWAEGFARRYANFAAVDMLRCLRREAEEQPAALIVSVPLLSNNMNAWRQAHGKGHRRKSGRAVHASS